MEFRVLGPLEVLQDGRPLDLRGTKRRAVLALLVLQANEVVRTDRLIEDLWGDHQPANATSALQNHVSRLRKDLGDDALITKPRGYVLRAAPDAIDLRLFERLVTEARPLPASERREKLGAALALWRGPALADLAHEPALEPERARVDELRQSVVEQQIDARLELGEDAEVVPELEELVAAYPLRERLRGQLILALYRSGRQAEALETYRETRRVLVEELGIEPSPELRELERAILRQDPALASARAPAEPEPEPAQQEPLQSRWRWPRSPLMVGAAVLVALAGAAAAILANPRGGAPHASAVKARGSSAAVTESGSTSTAESVVVAKRQRRHKPLPAGKPRHPANPPPQATTRPTDAKTTAKRSKQPTTAQPVRDEPPVAKPEPKPPPPPPPPPPPALITDHFDDGVIASDIWQPLLTGTGTAVNEQNRRLELSFDPDAAAAPNGQGFNMMAAQVGTECRFLGDFDVRVAYELVDWPSTNGVILQLAAWFRSSNSSIARQSQQMGETYSGWHGRTGATIPTNDRQGALRLRRKGARISSYVRSGGKWVRVSSSVSSEAPIIGLQAMSTDDWFSDQPVKAAFDDFEIRAAQPVC